jgi:hypothetical protein
MMVKSYFAAVAAMLFRVVSWQPNGGTNAPKSFFHLSVITIALVAEVNGQPSNPPSRPPTKNPTPQP